MDGVSSGLPGAVLFAALFAAVWAGAGLFMAASSGWRALAVHYRQQRAFEGESRWLQAGRFRWGANYGRSLVVGCGPAGLRLAVLAPFRVGHPPLVIPWSDVPAPADRGVGPFRLVEFRFAREPAVSLRVRPSLARWILEMRGRSEKVLDTSGANP